MTDHPVVLQVVPCLWSDFRLCLTLGIYLFEWSQANSEDSSMLPSFSPLPNQALHSKSHMLAAMRNQ